MPNIVDTAINAGNFNTLVTAITTAGLDTALNSSDRFTIFAPTDEAFSKLPSRTFELLLEDINLLRNILEYHLVDGIFKASDLVKLASLTTVEGSPLKIDATNGVRVNDAAVVTPDLEADNGVIHVIDIVLMRQ